MEGAELLKLESRDYDHDKSTRFNSHATIHGMTKKLYQEDETHHLHSFWRLRWLHLLSSVLVLQPVSLA